MMDENHIYVGNRVLIAPNVQFYTAIHPINFEERFVENWDENSGKLFFRTKALPISERTMYGLAAEALFLQESPSEKEV